MNRVEFTKAVCNLIAGMFLNGEHPVIDYTKRSLEEQVRLFALGKSHCDGVKEISRHQIGKAVDIYFVDLDDENKDGITQELKNPKMGWEYWHKYWEMKGGKPELVDSTGKAWDRGHFEG